MKNSTSHSPLPTSLFILFIRFWGWTSLWKMLKSYGTVNAHTAALVSEEIMRSRYISCILYCMLFHFLLFVSRISLNPLKPIVWNNTQKVFI